jgi:nanoRNase/pAp phosphatase (c-di-AMP/oligoRNAs hydrolase)
MMKSELEQLEKTVSGKKNLLIVVHNNPDPDAIMSGEALRYLTVSLCGIDASIAYGGYIGRAENQALVQKLGIKLKRFNRIRLGKYDLVACVDTQPNAGNNLLSDDSRCDIVIDHHPALSETKAPFTILKPNLGGTATILVEWLNEAGLPIPVDLATGLAYAISSETQHMGREATAADIEAYLSVYAKANLSKLSQIMLPKLPKYHFVHLARALQNAKVCRNLICSHLHDVSTPEVVAEMADFLVRRERISWSFCTGRFKGELILSLRTTNPDARAGWLIRKMVGSDYLAGGHGMIAGGSVPLEGVADDSLENRFTAEFARILGVKKPEWKDLLESDDIKPVKDES